MKRPAPVPAVAERSTKANEAAGRRAGRGVARTWAEAPYSEILHCETPQYVVPIVLTGRQISCKLGEPSPRVSWGVRLGARGPFAGDRMQ